MIDPIDHFHAVLVWKEARREILASGTTADELRIALDELGPRPKMILKTA